MARLRRRLGTPSADGPLPQVRRLLPILYRPLTLTCLNGGVNQPSANPSRPGPRVDRGGPSGYRTASEARGKPGEGASAKHPAHKARLIAGGAATVAAVGMVAGFAIAQPADQKNPDARESDVPASSTTQVRSSSTPSTSNSSSGRGRSLNQIPSTTSSSTTTPSTTTPSIGGGAQPPSTTVPSSPQRRPRVRSHAS